MLASYPKSGRTWFRYLLACYFALLIGGVDIPTIAESFGLLPNFDFDPVRGLLVGAHRRDTRMPRIAVTHRKYDPVLFGRVPVIFLVRDPCDVMVSAYFHETRHKHRFDGTVEQFLDSPLGLPKMIDYLNGWGDGLTRHRHLVLSYEQMSADPVAASRKALEFLGVPVNEGALERAVAAASFDRMRSLELRDGLPAHEYDRNDPQSLRMRKGKVGGYTETLSDENIAAIRSACAERLTPSAKQLFA